MPDLRTLMNEATATVASPSPSLVEADLTRGRRQRARQARRRALVPAGLAAAAAGVLAVSLLGSGPGAAGGTEAGGATAAGVDVAAPSAQQGSKLKIVLTAYQGAQPKGFTIDKIPSGWTLQGVDEYNLVLAPAHAKNTDPSQFDGKIAVGLANRGEISVERHEVHDLKVGDVTAKRFTFDSAQDANGQPIVGPDASPGLLLPAGEGRYLIFQFPHDLKWDDATIAEFAAGVHLTSDAVAGNG